MQEQIRDDILKLLKKLFKKLYKNKELLILSLLAVVFFFIYSYLPLSTSSKFISPDATANYFFARLYAEKTQLGYTESYNDLIPGFVHPRSITVIDSNLAPTSFLGMMLMYGSLGKIFGTWIIEYLTPLFSAIAILFFYLLIKEIFSKRAAFISGLLLFVQPAFWYYTSRSMMHNACFVSFLIIGSYFFIKLLKEKKLKFYILAGLFLGISLTIRTSEVIWISVVLLFLILIFRKRIKSAYLLLFSLSLFLVFIPIFHYNNQVFGSPLSFGYSKDVVSTATVSAALSGVGQKIKQLLFPFGIDFDIFINVFYNYYIFLFPLFSLSAFLGLAVLLRRFYARLKNHLIRGKEMIKKPQIIYAIVFLFVSFWLIVYYGSWELYEYSDKTKVILGSSYIRYWLPIYVFSLPFCSIFLLKIYYLFKKFKLHILFVLAILFLFVSTSVNKVILDPLYGLAKVKKDIANNEELEDIMLPFIEPNALILAGSNDKIFFPERKVIGYGLNDPWLLEKVSSLSPVIPVYYLALDPGEARYLNGVVNEYNTQLLEVVRWEDKTLYKISVNSQ